MCVELFSVRRRRTNGGSPKFAVENGSREKYFGTDGHDITMRAAAMMMPRHVMKTPAGMISGGRASKGQGTKIPPLARPLLGPHRADGGWA